MAVARDPRVVARIDPSRHARTRTLIEVALAARGLHRGVRSPDTRVRDNAPPTDSPTQTPDETVTE